MGQTLGSQRDPWAAEKEPKLLWDAKAVLVEVADVGFPVFWGGTQQVGEALRLADSS